MSKFGGKKLQDFLELQLQSWKDQPAKEIALIEPLLMNESQQAKMKIVEFADFLCIHCKNAFPKIHTFIKSHPDVELAFQAFPLDGACNDAISHSEGTRCYLAKLSHCAGKQNKGWETQKWIFDNQRDLVQTELAKQKLPELLRKIQINEEELNQCISDSATDEIIKKQAQLGKDIGVKGTPSIYVNGKKVQGLSLPLLKNIYSEVSK